MKQVCIFTLLNTDRNCPAMMNHVYKRLFFLLFFLICISGSYAQSIAVLDNHSKSVTLNAFAYVYQGNSFLHSNEFVIHADSSAFARNKSAMEVNYGFDQPSAWCKFSIRNTSDQKEWILKIQQSRVDTVQLFVVRENQATEIYPITGHFQTITERPVYSLPFAYAITVNKNETITCYLYTHRQYGRHAAIIDFQTKGYFENYEHIFSVSIGLVSGMILLATLIGFVLFLFVRENVYIYYSIYATSFFLLLMGDTGFTHSVLSFPNHQTIVNNFTIIFYYWMGGCHMLFTVELLQLKKYSSHWVYQTGLVMGYLFCLCAVILLLPITPTAVRSGLVSLSYYLVFPTIGFILYTTSVSFLKKEPLVYLYMAGFYITLLVGTVLTLSDFEILDLSFMNKDIFYFTPLVEILFMVMGLGIHFSKTIKERYQVQLKLSETQDQIITIQEDERRRIAQDLHDDVGNSLAAVRNMVVQKKDTTEVEKEISNVINTIRTISHNLMPVDFQEFSLVEIIGHLANKFKDHPSIYLEFNHSGNAIKINPLTELVIYRIINEIVTNLFKHSQASKAFIQLMYQRDSLVVTVEDNGIGIRSKPKTEEGIGLRSIRLRAAYIHATINVESDNKGTLIILEIPYEKK